MGERSNPLLWSSWTYTVRIVKIIANYGSRAKALYFTFLFIIYIIYFYITNGNICFHLATL